MCIPICHQGYSLVKFSCFFGFIIYSIFLKPDYFSNMALFTKTKVFVKEAVFSLKKKIEKENQVIKDEMTWLANLNDAVSKLYSFLFFAVALTYFFLCILLEKITNSQKVLTVLKHEILAMKPVFWPSSKTSGLKIMVIKRPTTVAQIFTAVITPSVFLL